MFLQSMRGIVERLDLERFEVVILPSRAILESLRAKLPRRGLRFTPFSDSLPEAIRQIRAAACDLIYYWEVGSDAMNYFLPYARLSPVQCTGWGSTITSGVPAVDWFLSSELVERPGSQSQYTERLWKSRTLWRYQDRLPAVAAATPADFGLPEGRNLYVCFQNPLKLHPDFDRLLAGVLEADPRGLVVLLADRGGQAAARLMERFARTIEGRKSEIQGGKSEIRNSKSETNPKSKIQIWKAETPSPPSGKSEIRNSKSETNPKSEIRNSKPETASASPRDLRLPAPRSLLPADPPSPPAPLPNRARGNGVSEPTRPPTPRSPLPAPRRSALTPGLG